MGVGLVVASFSNWMFELEIWDFLALGSRFWKRGV